ncbi:MAG: hypothetical protein AAF596_05315 [Planctomycetota bacterium]
MISSTRRDLAVASLLDNGIVNGAAALVLCMAMLGVGPEASAHPHHGPGEHHHHGPDGSHYHDADGATAFVAPAAADAVLEPETVASNQQDLADVFSQPSIINAPQNDFDSGIRVDFNPIVELDRPDLRVIDTTFKQQQVFALSGPGIAPGTSDTINVYYVDSISACGSFILEGIVGCGAVNGNDFIVESSFADSFFGAELLAHEIGHNLGLLHVGNNNSTGNLMNPQLNGSTTLTASQANTVLLDQRVNDDFVNGEHFITINPIAISELFVVNVVPEPSSAAILLALSSAAARRPSRRQNLRA